MKWQSLWFILAPIIASAQQGEAWYRVYSGKAGNLATIIHLAKSGKNYSGYVWFEQNQLPMQIYSGAMLEKSDSIQISSGSGPISFLLTGILSAEEFKGNSRLEKSGSPAKDAPFHLKWSKEKPWIPFGYYFSEGKEKLPAQYKNESQCEFFSASVWPGGSSPVEESLKKHIRQILAIKTPTTAPDKWLPEERNRVLSNWKKENSKMPPKETAEMGLSLSFQQESKLLVMHENDRLITMAHYNFMYSGGAHGNFNTQVTTIRKQDGKALQITDVLNAQGIQRLPAILEQVARVQYGVRNKLPLDQNGFMVKKIIPSKIMYVTGVSLGFIYAPYELRSFADGEVNLPVPLAALKPYLMPSFQ